MRSTKFELKALCLRHCIAAAAAGLLFALAGPASAQTYPNRPLKMVVPAAPGGLVDTFARLMALKLAEALGQPVVVDNRAGASGIVGTDYVAKSAADGYTLLMVPAGHSLNASLFDKLPYDPLGDFTPVSLLGEFSFVLVTPPSLPATSVRQLVEAARATPGILNYASVAGSLGHLAGEMFRHSARVNIASIPYKGVPQIAAALQTNEVQVFFDTTATALPQVKAGRLKALAVTGARRSPALPDVPTMAEAGIPDFELVGWNGILVRAGTPPEIVQRLNSELVQILKQKDVRDRLASFDVEPVGSTSGGIWCRHETEHGELVKDRARGWDENPMNAVPLVGCVCAATPPMRLGLMIPSNNTVFEEDAVSCLPAGSTCLTVKVPRGSALMDLENLPAYKNTAKSVAKEFTHSDVDIVIYGCTVAGFLGGWQSDNEFVLELEEVTGKKVISTAGVMVNALRRESISRLAIITPYSAAINSKLEEFLTSAGLGVQRIVRLDAPSLEALSRISEAEVFEAGMRVADGGCDGVLIACSQLPTRAILEKLRVALNRPVLSSNQMALQEAIRVRQQLVHAVLSHQPSLRDS